MWPKREWKLIWARVGFGSSGGSGGCSRVTLASKGASSSSEINKNTLDEHLGPQWNFSSQLKHKPLSRREANSAGERRLRGIGLRDGNFKGVGSSDGLGVGEEIAELQGIGVGRVWVTIGEGWGGQTCCAPVEENLGVSLLVSAPTPPPEPPSRVGDLGLPDVSPGTFSRWSNSREREMASQQYDSQGPQTPRGKNWLFPSALIWIMHR